MFLKTEGVVVPRNAAPMACKGVTALATRENVRRIEAILEWLRRIGWAEKSFLVHRRSFEVSRARSRSRDPMTI